MSKENDKKPKRKRKNCVFRTDDFYEDMEIEYTEKEFSKKKKKKRRTDEE